MIDLDQWNEEERFVLRQYGCRCVLCTGGWADTLHHEPPRSLNPRWEDQPWTQYPLCTYHHSIVHDVFTRREAGDMLEANQRLFYPGVIERIKEWISQRAE